MKASLPLIFVLSLFISCSNVNKPSSSVPEKRIQNFIEEVSADHLTSDPKQAAYLQNYQNYLVSVHDIFQKNGSEDKFDAYLVSLRNEAEQLEDYKKTLPTISSDTQTSIMTSMYDKLEEERVARLKNVLDSKLFAKLMENNQKFNEHSKNGRTELVVPF